MATLSCLVDLIDVTLACEDANSKLDVVTVAGVDAKKLKLSQYFAADPWLLL